MKSPSNSQFGLIIAYLLPGFIALAGIAPFAPAILSWLEPANQAEASFGPPLYVLLAATAVGIIASCFRWIVIDHIHQWTGITPPVWDDSRLEERLTAFNYLVENHYRYYQFVANTLAVIVPTYLINRLMKTSPLLGLGTDLGAFILCAALFAASRDALSKYYSRTSRLIGQVVREDSKEKNMYNGNHHDIEAGAGSKPRPEVKPQTKPAVSTKAEETKDKTKQSRK